MLFRSHELGGLFFEPTIMTNVDRSMAVTQEETFGPLAPLYRFESDDEVIEQANDTRFGLASYFYSQNLSRVYKVAEALEYGIVRSEERRVGKECRCRWSPDH